MACVPPVSDGSCSALFGGAGAGVAGSASGSGAGAAFPVEDFGISGAGERELPLLGTHRGVEG